MTLPTKSAEKYLSKYNLNSSKSLKQAFHKSYIDFADQKISIRLFSAIANNLRMKLQQNIDTDNLKLINAIESASELYFLQNKSPNLAAAENALRKYFSSLKTA